MSGFFGMVRTDGAPVERELLERIAHRLEFRGPDGTTLGTKENAGFCFVFLDTGTPHGKNLQPVCLGERFWLAGEVRFDGRQDLIAKLRDAGQRVAEGATDQEVLLFAWITWGADALANLCGDFSFGIWDARTQTLICARDFTGARPLYYAQGPGIFCFSNTLQVLRSVPGISAELDERFVRDFLLEGQCQDNQRTVWRAIHRLPPGYSLQFSAGKLDVRRFLLLPIEEPLRFQRPEEYLDNFRELLGQAVSDRLPEGKCSLYLSGGLDSASVCAMAARASSAQAASRALRAYTVSWRPLMEDREPEFAARTAAFLGLPHEIVEEGSSTPERTPLRATPEPCVENLLGRTQRLYRQVAGHSRVVLSGDGGDNVLDGQSWPYLKYLWKRGDWREIAERFVGYAAAHGKFPALHGGFRARLRAWFRQADGPDKKPSWLDEDFSRRVEAQSGEGDRPAESLPEHALHPQAYRGLHSGFWGSVLEEEDAAWTSVLLETRAPFLDVRLLKFLLRLPPVPWCIHKELTRLAMVDLLPVEILRRPKAPLLQDPLEVCQLRGGWQPEILKIPPKALTNFVEWESWLATLENCKGLLSWGDLYPLALAYWLKAIENNVGIE